MVEGYADRHKGLDVDAALDALALMRRASLMVRQLEAYFARHDLSQLRFLILIVIDREPECDGMGVSQVASRLDVSKPVMTRTMARLAGDGLLEIEADRSDARAKVLRLTAKGRAKLAAVLPDYFVLLSGLGRGDDR